MVSGGHAVVPIEGWPRRVVVAEVETAVMTPAEYRNTAADALVALIAAS